MTPSTTKSNTTTAAGCPSIRRFSRAGSATAAAYREAARDAAIRPRLRPRRRGRPSICFRPRTTTSRRRSRCSSTAAGGARSSRRCSARLAAGPNARGVTVAVAGYELCPGRSDRRHHRADAQRLPVAVAQISETHFHLRPFRRRASRRLHAGAGLESVCLRRAGRSGAGGLRDLRRVRSRAAGARFAECGFAAR